jgi:hypothetical protein
VLVRHLVIVDIVLNMILVTVVDVETRRHVCDK